MNGAHTHTHTQATQLIMFNLLHLCLLVHGFTRYYRTISHRVFFLTLPPFLIKIIQQRDVFNMQTHCCGTSDVSGITHDHRRCCLWSVETGCLWELLFASFQIRVDIRTHGRRLSSSTERTNSPRAGLSCSSTAVNEPEAAWRLTSPSIPIRQCCPASFTLISQLKYILLSNLVVKYAVSAKSSSCNCYTDVDFQQTIFSVKYLNSSPPPPTNPPQLDVSFGEKRICCQETCV